MLQLSFSLVVLGEVHKLRLRKQGMGGSRHKFTLPQKPYVILCNMVHRANKEGVEKYPKNMVYGCTIVNSIIFKITSYVLSKKNFSAPAFKFCMLTSHLVCRCDVMQKFDNKVYNFDFFFFFFKNANLYFLQF